MLCAGRDGWTQSLGPPCIVALSLWPQSLCLCQPGCATSQWALLTLLEGTDTKLCQLLGGLGCFTLMALMSFLLELWAPALLQLWITCKPILPWISVFTNVFVLFHTLPYAELPILIGLRVNRNVSLNILFWEDTWVEYHLHSHTSESHSWVTDPQWH
jgi:hypothetical protein